MKKNVIVITTKMPVLIEYEDGHWFWICDVTDDSWKESAQGGPFMKRTEAVHDARRVMSRLFIKD